MRFRVFVGVATLCFWLGVACGADEAGEAGENGFQIDEEQAGGDENGENGQNAGRNEEEEHYCSEVGEPRCPFDCRDLEDWPNSWSARADVVFRQLNRVREQGVVCGDEQMPQVQPLLRHVALDEASRCHSLDMAERGMLTHEGGDGSNEVQRARRAGYPSDFVGEIVASGYVDPGEVVEAWLESDHHCENLMFAHYEEMGVGFVELPEGGMWTVMFGTRE